MKQGVRQNSDDETELGCNHPSYRKELGCRIGTVIESFKTKTAAAETAGVTTQQLRNYISGLAKPSFEVLARLTQHTNISLDWLATGEGPMCRKSGNAVDDGETPGRREQILEFVVKTIAAAEIKYDRLISPEKRWDVMLYCRNLIEKNANTRHTLGQNPDNLEEDADLIYDLVAFTAKPCK